MDTRTLGPMKVLFTNNKIKQSLVAVSMSGLPVNVILQAVLEDWVVGYGMIQRPCVLQVRWCFAVPTPF